MSATQCKIFIQNVIYAVLLGFLLSGCDLLETKLITESGIAEEGLELDFREYHEYGTNDYRGDGADPELFLVMTTKKQMPCVNYIIEYQENKINKDPALLEIDLEHIKLPGMICLTAIGPASARLSFEDADDKSNLIIKDGPYTNQFELRVTKESVEIKPGRTVFAEFNYKRYYRKPENSFYFRCGTLTSMTSLCQEFHEIMQSELNISEFEFPKDGLIPYPGESQGKQVDHKTRYYKYESVEDFQKAGVLLEEFTKERIAGIDGNSISIINWRDQGYRSWMFE